MEDSLNGRDYCAPQKLENGEAPMLCYSYGCHTATSLNLNVGNKQWGYVAIRSAPEIAQSGW